MALLGLESLLEADIQVLFCYSLSNTKLGESLLRMQSRFANLSLSDIPVHSRKLQGLRNRFEQRQIEAIAAEFKNWNADAVLSVQGDIEISSRGLLAGRSVGIPAVSYIPFAHSQRDMGAKLGGIRDLFNSYLLNTPDAFITINEEAKVHFQRRGTKVPIDVVYNGIDTSRFECSRKEARKRFDLPAEKIVIALCGRLESKQKGQSFLLQALASSPFLRNEALTLLVGEGPDEALLKSEVDRLGLKQSVRFMGWCDTSMLYSGIDVLVIASRFEGMPLVMLEALAAEVPVIATDRDGMKEILPADWRYSCGDIETFVERLEKVIKRRPDADITRLSKMVREKMSIESFKSGFSRSVIKRCRLVS